MRPTAPPDDAIAPAPVVLITGAARRIGAAITSALHAAGYRIALHYHHSQSEALRLRERLEQERPCSTLLLQADLCDSARLPALVEDCIAHFGRLDALVNNASAFRPSPIGETSPATWDTLMATNAKAPFFLAQAAAPYLRQSHGTILNLTDVYAERPLAQHSAYCMSKAALTMLTLTLAQELAPEVRVNAIAPGAILWPESQAGANAETDRAAILERTALKRSGAPEDIAVAALFLLDQAAYCTGQILRVDGGRWLNI